MAETAQLILDVIQLGGISIIIVYLFWGLRLRIKGLEDTVKTQKDTLNSMKLRNEDLERVTKTYRELIESYPQIKTIYEDKNRALIEELKKAKSDLEQKEDELKQAQRQKKQSKNELEKRQRYLTELENLTSFTRYWLKSLESEKCSHVMLSDDFYWSQMFLDFSTSIPPRVKKEAKAEKKAKTEKKAKKDGLKEKKADSNNKNI